MEINDELKVHKPESFDDFSVDKVVGKLFHLGVQRQIKLECIEQTREIYWK